MSYFPRYFIMCVLRVAIVIYLIQSCGFTLDVISHQVNFGSAHYLIALLRGHDNILTIDYLYYVRKYR